MENGIESTQCDQVETFRYLALQFGPFEPLWETGTNVQNYWTCYAREDEDDPEDGRWQIAYVPEASPQKNWVTKTNYDILALLYYDDTNDYL